MFVNQNPCEESLFQSNLGYAILVMRMVVDEDVGTAPEIVFPMAYTVVVEATAKTETILASILNPYPEGYIDLVLSLVILVVESEY